MKLKSLNEVVATPAVEEEKDEIGDWPSGEPSREKGDNSKIDSKQEHEIVTIPDDDTADEAKDEQTKTENDKTDIETIDDTEVQKNDAENQNEHEIVTIIDDDVDDEVKDEQTKTENDKNDIEAMDDADVQKNDAEPQNETKPEQVETLIEIQQPPTLRRSRRNQN